jgi:hypothetical protein
VYLWLYYDIGGLYDRSLCNKGGLSNDEKVRFAAVRERAEKLGVLDINFSGAESTNSLVCYERTLDIIEKNKARLDLNAGEV